MEKTPYRGWRVTAFTLSMALGALVLALLVLTVAGVFVSAFR